MLRLSTVRQSFNTSMPPEANEYKLILDYWLARGSMGRGGICTDVPLKRLTASATKGRHCCIPIFWRKALGSFRELKLVPIQPGLFVNRNEALAEPFWVSKRFKIKNPEIYEDVD